MDGTKIIRFEEKPPGDGAWINGGLFVFSPKVIGNIDGDATIRERAPLQHWASPGRLCVYKHIGFWRVMDTLRDKTKLEELWQSGHASWNIWNGTCDNG